jgi:DNA-binding NarL/FixJ family response regulator
VLLYTGYSNEVNAEQVSQAGIRALIKKPVDTARLHELIRQVLSPRATSS